MLEPDTRELLLDLLRPLPGAELDQAIGTTYTLDLSALLVAPLAFAMFDWAVEDDGRPDPIAMLEALRRHAERTTVFHQAGMVALPTWQPLLVHLEGSVVAVTPPDEQAIFHPKLWLLRFVDQDDPGRFTYRLVVLSRNLTFDTSWDTVVILEGHRRGASQVGETLGTLVDGLVDRARTLGGDRSAALREVAVDVRDVVFDPPEDVDTVRLHVLGMGGPPPELPQGADQAVVVSPFLGPAGVSRGFAGAQRRTLVSRPESLDALPQDALAGVETRVMEDGLVDDDTARATGTVPLSPDEPDGDDRVLRGLHAKLYAYEQGGATTLLAGSVNATDPAWFSNVEVLVELVGRTSRFSIDSLLEPGDGQASFGSLLTDYVPSDAAEDDARETLGWDLDAARRAIGRLDFRARVEPHGEEYAVELTTDTVPELPASVTAVLLRRLSVGLAHAHPVTDQDGHWQVRYDRVPLRGVTAFFAVEVRATIGEHEDTGRFVVRASLEGDPPTRIDDVIASVLADRDDLLRYLLFLLADSGADAADILAEMGSGGGAGAGRSLFGNAPLLETMLQALARDPGKLDQVGRLIDDVKRSGRGEELLPDGLEQLFRAIAAARGEVHA